MRIKVTTGYRGVSTKEQYIAIGEYDSNDPILCGQAQFLVDTGRAVITQADAPKPPETPLKTPTKAK